MPNLSGQYNFNELCQKAGASAPWVKKVQRLLGLGAAEGGKGSRTYYSEEQVHIYSAVKKLRLINLEFEEIIRIFDLEKQLKAISSYSASKADVKDKDSVAILNLMILLPPGSVLVFDYSTTTKKKIGELYKLYDTYFKAIQYVESRARETEKIAGQMAEDADAFLKIDNENVIRATKKFGIKR